MKPFYRVLVCIGMLLLALLIGGVVYIATKWDKVDTQDIKTEDIIINPEIRKNVDLGEGYTNIALFGVDSRDGSLGEGNRTDCIIIASLNNETKEIKMVSVYRDTLLDLSEGTYQKCNSAYSYGGPTLAINMLNMNLDLDIQDYVTMDFGAISDVVDAIGGIKVTVTDEEVEGLNKYVQETADSAGKQAIPLTQSGEVLLDGVQATTYARIRSTAGGDFTRTERQRIVIEKIVEKLKKVDIRKLNHIIDEVFPKVSTSFSLPELMNYALAYKDYVLLGNTGFPMEYTLDSVPEVGSVVIPSDLTSNVAKLHEFLFGTVGYVPSSTVNNLSANILYTANGKGSSDMNTGYEENVVQNYNGEIENESLPDSNDDLTTGDFVTEGNNDTSDIGDSIDVTQ